MSIMKNFDKLSSTEITAKALSTCGDALDIAIRNESVFSEDKEILMEVVAGVLKALEKLSVD